MSERCRIFRRIRGDSEEVCNVAGEGYPPLTTEGGDSGGEDFEVVYWELLRHTS
jgi:hypothetical protein